MWRYLIWVNFVEVNIRRKSFRGGKMTKFQQKLVTFLWRSFSGKFLIAEISSSKISCRKVFSEATLQRCSYNRLLWKYAANLQENTHDKCDFNKVAKQLYWNHTSTWVFSCKFAAYLLHSCNRLSDALEEQQSVYEHWKNASRFSLIFVKYWPLFLSSTSIFAIIVFIDFFH